MSETSDDDGISSTNSTTRRSRSKSTEVGRKRGRPRKVPLAAPSPSAANATETATKTNAIMSPRTQAAKTTPKKETAASKRTAAAAAAANKRNPRQNANAPKSKAIVSTDDSSDDDSTPSPVKSNSTPNSVSAETKKVTKAKKPRKKSVEKATLLSPRQQALAANAMYSSSPTSRSPALRSGAASSLRNNSISPAASGRASSVRSKATAPSSDDDDDDDEKRAYNNSSSNDSDASVKNSKKVATKVVKSDNNKNKTLWRLFSSKGDGGAKGKGQVVIVDRIEDAQQQQHAQTKENSIPSEKLLSPFAHNTAKHTTTNPDGYGSTFNNVLVNGTSASSTEVSPLKSSNVNNTNSNKSLAPEQLLCKIDLSRLSRIPPGRNGRRNNSKSPMNAAISGRTSALHFQKRDEDRLSVGRNSENEFALNGRLSRNRMVEEDKSNRLSSSRDSR